MSVKKKVSKAKKASNRPASFNTKRKEAIEVAMRLAESYPMVGGATDDSQWRSLTQSSNRDLFGLTQKKMQDIAFYLYDSNPMAKRIIEITRDFSIGDGFTYSAEDKDVLEVIKNFWDDPDNNMDDEIDVNVLELGIFGELFLPVWVNKIDGAVKLGYIDPTSVQKVLKDKYNPKLTRKITYMRKRTEIVLDVINMDKKLRSSTYGYRVGDCFFFHINKVSAAKRGRSDLLTLSDWIDGHDQFLFARLERAFLLNTFIWDITCEGMNEAELTAFVQKLSLPKAGSIRAHNEKVVWKTESPKLESADASGEVALFKNQILGGAGFPGHWFAEGDKTTRATALEMSLPTLKKLKSRQRYIKSMLKQMINFVIDQAIVAGTLKKNVDRRFRITPSPIISRDNKGTITAIGNLVDGLSAAVERKWISDKNAKRVFNTVVSQLGSDIESSDQDIDEDEEVKVIKKGANDEQTD